jgi:hypothetical protein
MFGGCVEMAKEYHIKKGLDEFRLPDDAILPNDGKDAPLPHEIIRLSS